MSSNLVNKLKQLDERLSYRCFRSVPKTKKWKSILTGLQYSCNGIFWLTSIIILIYLNPGYKLYSYLLIGLILDIIYVALIKAACRRNRPYYGKNDQEFLVLSDKHSFPSGHATRAIYIAFFVNLFFKNLFLTSLITTWSIFVAVSRVLLGRHHLFDVICGCFIGYLEYLVQFSLISFLNPLFFSMILNVLGDNSNDIDDLTFDLD